MKEELDKGNAQLTHGNSVLSPSKHHATELLSNKLIIGTWQQHTVGMDYNKESTEKHGDKEIKGDDSKHHSHKLKVSKLNRDELSKESPAIASVSATKRSPGCGGTPVAPPIKDEPEPGKFSFQLLQEHCIRGRQGNRLYRCDVCGGVYRHAFSLKRHYLRTHVNYAYLSSSDISNCGINFPASGVTLPPLSDVKSAMPNLYRCHMCGKLFDEIGNLKTHVTNHPTSTSSNSTTTAATTAAALVAQTATISYLERSTPALTDRHVCMQCGATFSHRQNLVRHLAAHSGTKPFACHYCGKGFPTATNQRRHERIHEGLKPYTCMHCPSLFTQSGDLKKHVRSQHRDRFHPCTLCRKYFSTDATLAEHMATLHVGVSVSPTGPTNATPTTSSHAVSAYSCNICRKQFATQVALGRHNRMAHPRSRPHLASHHSVISNNSLPPVRGLAHGILQGEAWFYANVAHNISENLLHHVDGKIWSAPQPTPPPEADSDADAHEKRVALSRYNFPSNFDLNLGYSCESRCDINNGNVPEDEENMDPLDLSQTGLHTPSPEPEQENEHECESSKSGILRVFVCYACGERFPSPETIEDHKINNHPNVMCTHLELENTALDVPYELFRHHCSPEGALCRCSVPPPQEVGSQLQCTKCNRTLNSVHELHEHILDCGEPASSSVVTAVLPARKTSDRKIIRRGMKRRAACCDQMPVQHRAKRQKRDSPVDVCLTVETVVADRTPSVCAWCGQSFHHASSLERHRRSCPRRPGSCLATGASGTPPRHCCPQCGRSFAYVASLRKHSNEVCPLRNTTLVNSVSSENVPVPAVSTSTPPMPSLSMPCMPILTMPTMTILSSATLTPTAPTLTIMTSIASTPITPATLLTTHSSSTPIFASSVTKMKSRSRMKARRRNGRKLKVRVAAVKEIPVSTESTVEENDIAVEDPVVAVKEELVIKEEDEVNVTDIDTCETKMETASGEEKVEEVLENSTTTTCSEDLTNEGKKSVVKELPSEEESKHVVNRVDVVKKDEGEKEEEVKTDLQHSCPNCHRSFTYLANFNKHVNDLCPLRERHKDCVSARKTINSVSSFDVKKEGCTTKILALSPASRTDDCTVRDCREVCEGTVMKPSSLEDVSKTRVAIISTSSHTDDCTLRDCKGAFEGTVMNASSLEAVPRNRVPTFPCTICYRAFSSYVLMLKHRLSHKLKTSGNLVGRDDRDLSGIVPGGASVGRSDAECLGKRVPVKTKFKKRSLVLAAAVSKTRFSSSAGGSDSRSGNDPACKSACTLKENGMIENPVSAAVGDSDSSGTRSVIQKEHISAFRNAILSKVKGLGAT